MSPTVYRPTTNTNRNNRFRLTRLRVSVAIVALGLVGIAATWGLDTRPSTAHVVHGNAKPQ